MNTNGFEWRNVKVLVTGASGFKGSWLCAALLKLGARVYGTARPQVHPLSAYNILDLDRKIVKVEADISDRQKVYDMINSVEPDVLFHLAAKALVPVSLRDPRRTFEINVMGTVNIIEACRKLKVSSRLLICSTDHVFGSVTPDELPKGGFCEASPVSYGGPYDTSKAAMELTARSYHYSYWDELPAIGITRCANVFGYGDTNDRRIIPYFVSSSLNDGVAQLRFRYNGRQFIHITDAVAGYILAASNLDEGGRKSKAGKVRPEDRSPFTPTYHFSLEKYEGTDNPYITMEAFADLVALLYKSRIDQSECIDYAPNENKVQALNCSVTREQLGWEPRRSFADGLQQLGDWYRFLNNRESLKQLIERELAELIENNLASSSACS